MKLINSGRATCRIRWWNEHHGGYGGRTSLPPQFWHVLASMSVEQCKIPWRNGFFSLAICHFKLTTASLHLALFGSATNCKRRPGQKQHLNSKHSLSVSKSNLWTEEALQQHFGCLGNAVLSLYMATWPSEASVIFCCRMLMLLRNGAKIWSLNELMRVKAMSGGNDWGVPEA